MSLLLARGVDGEEKKLFSPNAYLPIDLRYSRNARQTSSSVYNTIYYSKQCVKKKALIKRALYDVQAYKFYSRLTSCCCFHYVYFVFS